MTGGVVGRSRELRVGSRGVGQPFASLLFASAAADCVRSDSPQRHKAHKETTKVIPTSSIVNRHSHLFPARFPPERPCQLFGFEGFLVRREAEEEVAEGFAGLVDAAGSLDCRGHQKECVG